MFIEAVSGRAEDIKQFIEGQRTPYFFLVVFKWSFCSGFSSYWKAGLLYPLHADSVEEEHFA